MKDVTVEDMRPELIISVIIPTCHRNDLLAKCLDCLAPGAQTLLANQYEVIVTDDGSNSTAEELVRDHYPWVRWIAGPRRGPAANRNCGAKYAEGDWLAFTDDDCLPSAGWLEAFINAFTPEYQVYEGKTTCEAGIKSPLYHAPINETGGWLWSCNMMLTKTVFTEFGGFDEAFPYPHMEDTYFRELLKQRGHPFVFISNAIVDHPPRKKPFGARLGATHECGVLYSYKVHNSPLSFLGLVKSILKFRSYALIQTPISLDWLVALISAFCELWHVLLNLHRWNKSHSPIK